MKKILLGSLVASTLAFGSNSAEININNDTLEVAGELYLNNNYNVSKNSNYYLTASYLRSENDGEENQSLTTLGFKVINPFTDDNGISLGLGIKSIYASEYDKSILAIPLSVYGRYELNEVIYFDLDVGYAPRVLSFLDGEKYVDGKLKVNYKVLSDGYAFAGARSITTTYENGMDVKYDTSLFVGFKVRF
jgi:hypothetical protein